MQVPGIYWCQAWYIYMCIHARAWPLSSATPHGECTEGDQSGQRYSHSDCQGPSLRALTLLVRIRVRVWVRVRVRVRVSVRVSGQGQGQ